MTAAQQMALVDGVRSAKCFFAEESLTISENNAGIGSLNLGMYQLITRERERLGIRFVCDHEIWQSLERPTRSAN